MGKRDLRVDDYIKKAPTFARPILKRLRADVHAACPDVVETLKWSMPSFEHHGMMCGMAAFKAHCAFGFWKHALVLGAGDDKWKEAMGSFGCLKSLDDLPSSTALKSYVKKAATLNEQGIKAPRTKTGPRKSIPAPKELTDALKRNAKARKTWEAFSPSNKREYAEWISQAKGEDTRARRLEQAIAWMAEGKPRNWKYQRA